ncbi:MAG: DNA recombination protein RmuC [Pseudomonadota bacterium]
MRVLKPAETTRKAKETTYFEPAGDDVDITFEEPAIQVEQAERKGFFGRRKKAKPDNKARIAPDATHHVEEERHPDEAEIVIEAPAPQSDKTKRDVADVRAEPTSPKRNGSRFSGLFSRGRDAIDAEAEPLDDKPDGSLHLDDRLTEDAIEPENDQRDAQQQIEQESLRSAEVEAAAAKARADREIADAERRALNAERDAERRVAEEQRRSALAVEQNTVQNAIARQDEAIANRFRDLSDRLETAIAAAGGGGGQSLAAVGATPDKGAGHEDISSLLDARFTDLGETISAALNDLGVLIDARLSASAALQVDEQTSATGNASALADIVSETLPASAYEFRKSNMAGRVADCVVNMPGFDNEIVIDGQFPMEAYHQFVSERLNRVGEKAENEFRSAVLRHIVAVSDQFIDADTSYAPVLLYISSERAFGDIQSRFPDLVRDSQNARILIVSPTTLAATLQTMRSLSRVAAPAADEASDTQALLHEIANMRQRIAVLEAALYGDSNAPSPNSAPVRHSGGGEDAISDIERASTEANNHSLSREEEAFDRLERAEIEQQTFEDADVPVPGRSAFPLR